MAKSEVNEQLSLSWDAHQKSICNGLSQLQQRGEFVDMTLAADGHHVKVHQMVLSLVSPYIKDLLSTAQCPHPIIFLNNISYTTLSAILEYIYTGEVQVPKHRLPDLITAGKALHIRGLREMDDKQTADSDSTTKANPSPPRVKSISERLRALKQKKIAAQPKEEKKTTQVQPMCKIYVDETDEYSPMDQDSTIDIQDSTIDIQHESTSVGETTLDTTGTLNNSNNGLGNSVISPTSEGTRKTLMYEQDSCISLLSSSQINVKWDVGTVLVNSKVQYTVSNQGGLQTIFNRYMYQLRYISKSRKRSWRCIEYNKNRCSATIFTNSNDEVTEQTCSHNHPFHDKNILKKLRIVSHKLQYTMSNQGGLQVIHNRFIYHLRYFGKKNRKRLWRCIDYSSNLKCPANVCTNENNQVTERSFTHNHGFHDEKILKKVQLGMIYSILHEAEKKAEGKKKERRVPCSATVESEDET